MHALSREKGKFITEENHKPLYKRAKTLQYYSELMEKFSPFAVAFLNTIVEEKPLEWKRMCNGVLRLGTIYVPGIINQACEKALQRRKCDYRFVKEGCELLKKQPEEIIDPEANKGICA